MAQLFYGDYAFQPDSVWFTIMQRTIIGRTGRPNYRDITWNLTGRVSGNNTSEVVTAVEELQAALVSGYNLVFSIYHQLLSNDCVSGTQVMALDFLPGFDAVRGSGAELVLRRTFRAVISGRQVVASDSDIINYFESVRGGGTGGPNIMPVPSLAGDVQAQQVTAKSFYTQIQSGFSTGLLAYPVASTPIWQAGPAYYFPNRCSVTLDTPNQIGINLNTGFTTRWHYESWYTSPLVSSPIIPF